MAEERFNQDDAWRIGQKVQITAGPFIGFKGVISQVDRKEQQVRVMVDIFTRPSPVQVPFSSIKTLDREK